MKLHCLRSVNVTIWNLSGRRQNGFFDFGNLYANLYEQAFRSVEIPLVLNVLQTFCQTVESERCLIISNF